MIANSVAEPGKVVASPLRFHCLGLPHTVTSDEYTACAFTQKCLKFCKMMHKRGHTIFHYGHADSVVDCHEHITLLDNADLQEAYGDYDWRKGFFKHCIDDHCHVKFNKVGTEEIRKRLVSTDFVLCFWGQGHAGIARALENECFVVEPGIGNYCGFLNYRIYESYACMHHTQGLQNTPNPSWYHAVIPNYFDPNQFEFSTEKDNYFLFLGRISECKGLHIAIQACEALGCTLKVAGQGPIEAFPSSCVEYIGHADVVTRKRLLKNAKGLLIFSNYVEPFGGVCVEAMLSGTPVICPDYGCFTETVPHGRCGYRVRTFGHILTAMRNVKDISAYECRKWAMQYALENVAPRYEEYFHSLLELHGEGWYTKHDCEAGKPLAGAADRLEYVC